MGRHHIKLPDYLYISSPPPPPSSSSLTSVSSFLSSKSGLSYTSAAFLLPAVPNTRAFERRIPGFKTSAAFLSALRANLDLQQDYLDSPVNTPDSLRPVAWSTSSIVLPPPSPFIQAMSTAGPYTDADLAPPPALGLPKASNVESEEDRSLNQEPADPNAIPELTTFAADDEASRIEALRLVADSVAQQRQRANRALIFHPITIGLLAIAFSVLHQYFYKGETSDYAIIGTTFAGILMTMLVGVRSMSGAYLEEAERTGTWRWLRSGRDSSVGSEPASRSVVLGEDDEILVTKFGDEYIGTIVFRGVQPVDLDATTTSKKMRKTNSALQPKTQIRAWTVRQKYRGKGVGTALLEDAIKISHEQGWFQGGIEIADDHANSKVVLPKMFSAFVQNNDKRARQKLEAKAREFDETRANGRGKRRK